MLETPTPAKPIKKRGRPPGKNHAPYVAPKKIAVTALLKEGELSQADIARSVGCPESYVSKLKKQHDLTNNLFVSKASKAVKNLIEAKTFGEMKEVKASTVLEAAKMVYDRVQPIVNRSVTLNANIQLADLSAFRDANAT